jgi:3-methyladenine DNA glycosylase AlkD
MPPRTKRLPTAPSREAARRQLAAEFWEEMDRWCRELDTWAVCDTMCSFLFDRTPHAFDKVA